MSCKGCGRCCRDFFVEIVGGVDDIPDRYVEWNDSNGADGMIRRKNGTCLALDEKTNLCTIYDRRPLVCKQFKKGSAECSFCIRRLE